MPELSATSATLRRMPYRTTPYGILRERNNPQRCAFVSATSRATGPMLRILSATLRIEFAISNSVTRLVPWTCTECCGCCGYLEGEKAALRNPSDHGTRQSG